MAKSAKATNNGASLGFEQKLWQAADKLRSNLDAAEYKHVVLGLIFLKYISDSFQEHYQALLSDPMADPEDKDEYTACNIFWVPAQARWNFLQGKAHTPEIGKLIDEAMDAIEKDNRQLKNILPKSYSRADLDKAKLGELVDLIGTIGLGDKENRSKDILGRVYEYFLSEFASAEGKQGGQFYTPRCVVQLLVEMLAPAPGKRIYDPCCGSGGMFVQSEKFIEAHGGKIGDISIFGQESNPTTWRLAKMNLAIRGIEADLVDCVVALPDKLFYSTGIPACLWFLTRNKSNGKLRDRRGHTLFIDARSLGMMRDRVHRELTDEEVVRIASCYHAWRGDPDASHSHAGGNPYQDLPGFCKSVPTSEIAAQSYVLTPGRYVGMAPKTDEDAEPFETKMRRLTVELYAQFAESARLEKEIRANMTRLGFGEDK